MKKLFIEPDMEILTFRCEEIGSQPDSINMNGSNPIQGNPDDVVF